MICDVIGHLKSPIVKLLSHNNKMVKYFVLQSNNYQRLLRIESGRKGENIDQKIENFQHREGPLSQDTIKDEEL